MSELACNDAALSRGLTRFCVLQPQATSPTAGRRVPAATSPRARPAKSAPVSKTAAVPSQPELAEPEDGWSAAELARLQNAVSRVGSKRSDAGTTINACLQRMKGEIGRIVLPWVLSMLACRLLE